MLTPIQIAALLAQLEPAPDALGDNESLAVASDEKTVISRSRPTEAPVGDGRPGAVHHCVLRQIFARQNAIRSEYVERLRIHPETLDLLHRDLLIRVTRFFRDPQAFAGLRESAFPK